MVHEQEQTTENAGMWLQPKCIHTRRTWTWSKTRRILCQFPCNNWVEKSAISFPLQKKIISISSLRSWAPKIMRSSFIGHSNTTPSPSIKSRCELKAVFILLMRLIGGSCLVVSLLQVWLFIILVNVLQNAHNYCPVSREHVNWWVLSLSCNGCGVWEITLGPRVFPILSRNVAAPQVLKASKFRWAASWEQSHERLSFANREVKRFSL